MSSTELKNIALLIDADNTTPRGIDPVLTVMAELGQVNIKRAYGNFAKNNLANWGTITHKFGIRPQQQFDLTAGKNATDMAMTIDAIDLLYQGKVDGFGIMSSDSDFTPLATRLRQDGLIVYGFGSKNKTPDAFKSACTRFIDIDALIAGASEEDGTAKKPKSGTKGAVDEELVELLGTAWKAANRDEDGYAQLGEVGSLAGNRSSFDVRNYGYKRLSDLFEAMEQFKVERRDNTLYVKRLR
ncbi:OST-HTH/LOTUS domain-containing protein [Altererythrobacter xiamenensis]|uniref:OST-HTH/LOTUS domain-containing protein n=1 Tax=Altererythrobacter xiamenensis TaxID=1316679 RepID=A0A1Y6FM41_9SPHN|nr:NYN domain-containing protein [Altererythrobacter xiamenensis]SMQ74551.1 OST-HTH/LOTUS domain-containing protein [Altererythrobacter xiamenensis]